MTKILVINHCIECPNGSYNPISGKTHCSVINVLISDFEKIPDTCPLPNKE